MAASRYDAPQWDFSLDKLIVTWRIEAGRLLVAASETDRHKRLTRLEDADVRGQAKALSECSDRLEKLVMRLRYGKASIV